MSNDKKMEVISVEIPDPDSPEMEEFQAFMDAWQDEMTAHIQKEADELGLSFSQASDVVYLRTRSRHTPELEEELIQLLKKGKNPPVLQGWDGEPEEEWDSF